MSKGAHFQQIMARERQRQMWVMGVVLEVPPIQDLHHVSGDRSLVVPRIAEQRSLRRTQVDSDDEPLVVVAVAEIVVESPELVASNSTVDVQDGGNAVVCNTMPASSNTLGEAGVQMSTSSTLRRMLQENSNTSSSARSISKE